MSKCVNSTKSQNSLWQPVCDTPENIQNGIKTDTRINILMTNTQLNPEKTQNYALSYLNSIIFSFQPEKMFTTVNVMLNKQTIETDNSLIPVEDIESQQYALYSNNDFKQSFSVGNFSNYCEIYFLRSFYSTNISRQFLKLDEVISYIGGFCQVFLLFSAVIVSYYNEYVYVFELANRLYDFDIRRKKNVKKPKKLDQQTLEKSTINTQTNKNSQINTPKQLMTTEADEKFQINNIPMLNDNTGNMKSLAEDGRVLCREDLGLMPFEQIQKMIEKHSDMPSQSQHSILNYKRKLNIMESSNIDNIDQKKESIQTNNNFKQAISLINKQIQQTELNQNKHKINGDIIQKQQTFNLPQQNNPQLKKEEQNPNKSDNEILDLDQIYVQKEDQDQTTPKYAKFEQVSEINQRETLYTNRQSRLGSVNNPSKSPGMNALQSNYNILKSYNLDNKKQYPASNSQTLYLDNKQQDNQNNIQNQEENKIITQINNVNKLRNEKINLLDTKEFLDRELKFIISRERSQRLNFKFFLNKLSCGKLFNTEEVQLLNKAEDMVRQDLDIFSLIDRIKELNKFKNLLLTPEQQTLFNFFPKPFISIEKKSDIIDRQTLITEEKQDAKRRQSLSISNKSSKKLNIKFRNIGMVSKAVMRLKGQVKKDQLSDYQKLFNCYEQLLLLNIPKSESRFNQKLIDLLGDEMKNIFKLTRKMKEKNKERDRQINKNASYSNIFKFQDKSQEQMTNQSIFDAQQRNDTQNKEEEQTQNIYRESQSSLAQIPQCFTAMTSPQNNLISQKFSNKISNDVIIFEQDDTDLSSVKDQ